MRDRIIGKIKMFIKRDALFSAEAAAISIADIYAIILSGVIDAPVIISGMFLLCIATVCWYYVGHQQASPKEKRVVAIVKTLIIQICFALMIAMLLILQLTDKGTKMIQIAFPAAVITASVILVQGRIRASVWAVVARSPVCKAAWPWASQSGTCVVSFMPPHLACFFAIHKHPDAPKTMQAPYARKRAATTGLPFALAQKRMM